VRAEEARRLTRDQLAAILAGIAEGVAVQDAAGQWVYANDVAGRLSGYSSGEAMLSANVASTVSRFTLPDGRVNLFHSSACLLARFSRARRRLKLWCAFGPWIPDRNAGRS
jgi:PAS domain-containing protein